MPETDFGMPGMPENLACGANQKIWPARHAGDFSTRGMLGMNFSLEPRLLAARVRRLQKFKICFNTGNANFCCMPIKMQKHSGATPSIASEQIIDDRHEKNPCMLTKIENVAEMSPVAESCPRGGS